MESLDTITKIEFKRMHSSGELLLLTAGAMYLSDVREKLQTYIDEGKDLYSYARNTTRADVSGYDTTIHYDKENNLIYVYTVNRNSLGKLAPFVVVYLTN